MSQSWDNVASVHDHLLTVRAHKDRDIVQTVSCLGKIVLCACADWSGCRGHTPHSKQLAASCSSDVLALLERCYRTIDRYDKEQHQHLLSRPLEKHGAFTPIVRQCNASLWTEALMPLFFVHTALQFWPILSLVVWTSLRPCRTFIATRRIQDAYPRPHVMTRTTVGWVLIA